MFKDVINAANIAIQDAINSGITNKIAQLLKQQKDDLTLAGFSHAEAMQIIIAIAGKKS